MRRVDGNLKLFEVNWRRNLIIFGFLSIGVGGVFFIVFSWAGDPIPLVSKFSLFSALAVFLAGIFTLFLAKLSFYLFLSISKIRIKGVEVDVNRIRQYSNFDPFLRSLFKFLWWILVIEIFLLLFFLFISTIFFKLSDRFSDNIEIKVENFRSLYFSSLFDRNGKYIGIYTNDSSSQVDYYSHPELLYWKISRAVSVSRGKIDEPFELKVSLRSFISFHLYSYHKLVSNLNCIPFFILNYTKHFHYFFRKKSEKALANNQIRIKSHQNIRIYSLHNLLVSYKVCEILSPRDIMSIYLATVWSGYKNYRGIHNMALFFFGTDELPSLSWEQAIVLAASLENPKIYNPIYLKNCIAGRCRGNKKEVFSEWIRKIIEIRNKIEKTYGIKIPSKFVVKNDIPYGLPKFRNGLEGYTPSISQHRKHLQLWIKRYVPFHLEGWHRNAEIYLSYNNLLMRGKDGHSGLFSVVKSFLSDYRGAHQLQIGFVLIDGRNGEIVGLYGGERAVDMAYSLRFAMGDIFKIFTFLAAAKYWPEKLPLINSGPFNRSCRSFIIYPYPGARFYPVKNRSHLPAYISLGEAIFNSADIALVFLAMRWTWFVPFENFREIINIGVKQIIKDKLSYSDVRAELEAKRLLQNPKALVNFLIRYENYRVFFRKFREKAAFEYSKVRTITYFLTKNKESSSETLLALSRLLDLEFEQKEELSSSFPSEIVDKFQEFLSESEEFFLYSPLSLKHLSWNREFRIEMGLRYLIYLAQQIAGIDRYESNLRLTIDLPLGRNIKVSAYQLSRLALFLITGKTILPTLVRKVEKDGKILFRKTLNLKTLPVDKNVLSDFKSIMEEVLYYGRASSAGKFLRDNLAHEEIPAGAYIGGDHRNRGVSCIGFLEHRIGAVTISSVNNRSPIIWKIKKFYLRKYRGKKKLQEIKNIPTKYFEIERKLRLAYRRLKRNKYCKKFYKIRRKISKKRRRLKYQRYLREMVKYRSLCDAYTEIYKYRRALKKLWKKLKKYYYSKRIKLKGEEACSLLFRLLANWKRLGD